MCLRESLLHWGGVGIGQGQSHLLDDQGIFEMTHHVQTDVTHVRPLPYHKNADENEEDGCQYANSVNYKKKLQLFHVVLIVSRLTYLVFKKGIIMPAAVATSNRTTCRTVSTTLISFTTSARAFELSIPSTVTYCCWDMCSILEI